MLLVTRPIVMTLAYAMLTVFLCGLTAIPSNANRQDLRTRS
ncbi:hypothetical protein [Microbacterium jiangjiandongii]|nr:hypothetical protein [Microbacterium sp. zg.Y843]MCR2815526.1 hypothetical protein [Microbacterium sp. zg.Y843]